MPLDTPPLSPTRKIVLIIVLLALLVGSLGLAELLVLARAPRSIPGPTTPSVVLFKPPPPFSREITEFDQLDGLKLAVSGPTAQGERTLLGFSYLPAARPGDLTYQARELLRRVDGARPPEHPVKPQSSILAGFPALQLEADYAEPQADFTLERIADIHGKLVAICYGGPGPITDDDRALFNVLCQNAIVINDVPALPR